MGTFIFVIICDKLDVGGNLYARIDCTEHMVFFYFIKEIDTEVDSCFEKHFILINMLINWFHCRLFN